MTPVSFSAKVKEELSNHYNKLDHCRAAEKIAGEMISRGLSEDIGADLDDMIKRQCCKRAFLRGAFIAGGTISDPNKDYHIDISVKDKGSAEIIVELLKGFGIKSRISRRRTRYVVYIKEGVDIADMLNVIEAHKALMDFENARIVREMRGNLNRQINCEAANIGKTVGAAIKQIEDIDYIDEKIGLDKLDEDLKEIALVRKENPETPLSKLGELLNPPIGKSGVNHRLRKINVLASELRQQGR